MSIIDTLITDRTQEDLSTLTQLTSRPLSEWTAEELQGFNQAKSKGAYNYTDLNRVGEAMAYLSGVFNQYGYNILILPKTNWAKEDMPTEQQMTQYLEDLKKLRDALSVLKTTPNAPNTMDDLTIEKANAIEQILLDVETLIQNLKAAWFFCGEIYCGEVLP